MKKILMYLGVCILLVTPLMFTALTNDGFNLSGIVLGTIGVTLLLFVLYDLTNKLNAFLAIVVFIGSLLCLFLIRLTFAIVYSFSGRGFSSEFFAHIGGQSLIIGLGEYRYVLLAAIILLLLSFILLIKFLNKQKTHKLLTNTIVLIISLGLIATNLNSSPEWSLLNSYNRYNAIITEFADNSTVRAETSAILKPLRRTSRLPVEKHEITATAPVNPKNIIIIYLESFSEILTENQQYKNLTPNLDKLKEENISFVNSFSSGYITIEGIANSQCGTLMNIDHGNNSLTNATGRLANLPCLGDILHKAGYKQVFYGGALLGFAGKGAFLSEHGYDEVKGLKHWREKGLDNEVTWGLADTNLYDQALQRILELKKEKQPFNLTLLTLGTHVPGFSFESCDKYPGIVPANQFLDAVHCTDYLVGKFIQQLEKHNILEDTVVYIQGDHAMFSTRSMVNIFGTMVGDRRILSIIMNGDKENLQVDTKKPTTTTNMVANVLHLLEIKHNVDFIFAYSDFEENMDKPYLLTRRADYYGLDVIYNASHQLYCDDPDNLSFPLNSCEKRKALNAVYRLGASYSGQLNFQQVCQIGVEISIDAKTQKVGVKWGNQDLSQHFLLAGRKSEETKLGLYLLLLDSNDQVLNQYFYRGNHKREIVSLDSKLASLGQRYVLFSNLPVEQLLTLKMKNLPKSFIENKIIYMENTGKETISLFDQTYNIGHISFIPNSCGDMTKVTQYKAKKIESHEYSMIKEKLKQIEENSEFCEIKRWGPQRVKFGEKFLEQPDGSSAFWVETNCVPDDTVFRINGHNLNTRLKLPIITASIDEIRHIKKPGLYTLELFHEALNKSITIGELNVAPAVKNPVIQKNTQETP